MNVPGSFRCVPKKTEKIKPVIQGEPKEFFFFFFNLDSEVT